PLALVYLGLGVFYVKSFLKKSIPAQMSRLAVFTSAYILGSIGLMYVLAKMSGFPFWGRHFSPIVPAVITMVGLPMALLWRKIRTPLGRYAAVGALPLLLIYSALMLRFSPEYYKQDYRSATRFALEQQSRG